MATVVEEMNEILTEPVFTAHFSEGIPTRYREYFYYMDSVRNFPWRMKVEIPPEVTPGKHGNAEQFAKTIEYLEKMNPTDFDMQDWSKCIAGACLKANGYTFSGYKNSMLSYPNGKPAVFGHPMDIAADLLGISQIEAHKLFCHCGWPTIDGEAMFPNSATGAAERLKYYQETGL